MLVGSTRKGSEQSTRLRLPVCSLPALRTLTLLPMNFQLCSNDSLPALVPGTQDGPDGLGLSVDSGLPACAPCKRLLHIAFS